MERAEFCHMMYNDVRNKWFSVRFYLNISDTSIGKLGFCHRIENYITNE